MAVLTSEQQGGNSMRRTRGDGGARPRLPGLGAGAHFSGRYFDGTREKPCPAPTFNGHAKGMTGPIGYVVMDDIHGLDYQPEEDAVRVHRRPDCGALRVRIAQPTGAVVPELRLTPSPKIAGGPIHPASERLASFFIQWKKIDQPDQAVRLDELFPEQDPDKLPILVPPGSELARGQVVDLKAVARPIQGVGVPNRPGSTLPSPG
jgi:hypothetical protein